ncbi:MAG: cyclodeaminase/cyclohydrolase family protein [Acidobacteriota bacterium]
MTEKTLKGFLEELSSSNPTPGGGSISALAGAIGASLLEMVCGLTIGKEKFKKYEEELIGVRGKAAELKIECFSLIEKDAEAFNNVMASYRMPKGTDAEKKARSEAIERATCEATRVPLETARLCLEVLKHISSSIAKVNPNAISDIGVGALLAQSGIEGAALNVIINVPSIQDQLFREESEKKIMAVRNKGKALKEDILNQVEEMIKGSLE